MDESRMISVLKSLELDASRIESLSESDLCTLIGFLDYDARLQAKLQDREESALEGLHPRRFATLQALAPGNPGV